MIEVENQEESAGHSLVDQPWFGGEGGKALIVRRVSVLGLILGISATSVLAGWSVFGTVDRDLRETYRIIIGLMAVLLGFWALAFHWSGCGRVRAASVINVVSATAACFLFVAIEGGAVLATVTAVVALTAASLLFDGRELQIAGLFIIGGLMAALVVREIGWIGGLTIPHPLLLGATASAIVCGLPTMTAVFRLYSSSLKSSREEAVAGASKLSEANRRLAAHARELGQMTVELGKRDAENRNFLFVVTHDLRAPLINLEGFSDTIRETIEALNDKVRVNGNGAISGEALSEQWRAAYPELKDSLHFISNSAVKMDRLVSGLLELSQIDSGLEETALLDLDQLVSTLAESMHHKLFEKKISLQIDSLPMIEGDPNRVSQLFGNLLDNAVKNMVEDSERTIEIQCREADSMFEFSVRDTGCGIRPEDRDRIFRPFARLDPKKTAGEGMGLAVVQKIVERYRGRVWVESTNGQGSTFHFTWPRPQGMTDGELRGGSDVREPGAGLSYARRAS
jgi:signal transduction histidine kinase